MPEIGDSMLEILRIASTIGSPIALVAFLIIGAIYVYWSIQTKTLEAEQKKLESLPKSERAKAVDDSLAKYNLTAANLTRDQKYDLIVREQDKRHEHLMGSQNKWFWGTVISLIFLLVLAAMFFGFGGNRPSVTPPPVEFETRSARHNYGLPDEIFGSIQDATRPREWLESLDTSAMSKYGKDGIPIWLYTAPFEHSHGTFTVHVDAGTSDGIDIQAFRIWKNGRLQRESLDKLDGQGSRAVYRFDVSSSNKDDMIVVFLGMSKETYEAIPKAHRFSIRSKPLQVK